MCLTVATLQFHHINCIYLYCTITCLYISTTEWVNWKISPITSIAFKTPHLMMYLYQCHLTINFSVPHKVLQYIQTQEMPQISDSVISQGQNKTTWTLCRCMLTPIQIHDLITKPTIRIRFLKAVCCIHIIDCCIIFASCFCMERGCFTERISSRTPLFCHFKHICSSLIAFHRLFHFRRSPVKNTANY